MIKLNAGEIKQMVWKDRQKIAASEVYLFYKFGVLYKYFLDKGHTVRDSRGQACMYLAFPFMRTLRILDDQEMCDIMNDIYDIVNHFEMRMN